MPILLTVAIDVCTRIATASPLAAQVAKQAFERGIAGTLDEAISQDYAGIRRFVQSHDAVEALDALREKRTTVWKGQ